MNWKCLIVDDELIARKLLSEYASKIPGLEVVASCASAMEAMDYVRNNQIDILLLDIQMPDLTGLDFLKILPKKPATILTTAFSEHAIKAYELDVVDYLLKPIEFDRFYKAINKATGMLMRQPHLPESTPGPVQDKLFVKTNNKIIKLGFDEIVLVNGQGAYVQIITTSNRKIMSLQSMSKLAGLLPGNFYRTHRSHIININHIDSINGNTIVLGDHEVILSKNKREEFLQLIDPTT